MQIVTLFGVIVAGLGLTVVVFWMPPPLQNPHTALSLCSSINRQTQFDKYTWETKDYTKRCLNTVILMVNFVMNDVQIYYSLYKRLNEKLKYGDGLIVEKRSCTTIFAQIQHGVSHTCKVNRAVLKMRWIKQPLDQTLFRGQQRSIFLGAEPRSKYEVIPTDPISMDV